MVGGRVRLGVKPDVPGSNCRRADRQRRWPSLPAQWNWSGLVPRPPSRDFWVLDLATKKTHALTRLSDDGVISAFDITPDGKEVVFDRLRNNSNIVLIDLPK
jgi:hypothetical protein